MPKAILEISNSSQIISKRSDAMRHLIGEANSRETPFAVMAVSEYSGRILCYAFSKEEDEQAQNHPLIVVVNELTKKPPKDRVVLYSTADPSPWAMAYLIYSNLDNLQLRFATLYYGVSRSFLTNNTTHKVFVDWASSEYVIGLSSSSNLRSQILDKTSEIAQSLFLEYPDQSIKKDIPAFDTAPKNLADLIQKLVEDAKIYAAGKPAPFATRIVRTNGEEIKFTDEAGNEISCDGFNNGEIANYNEHSEMIALRNLGLYLEQNPDNQETFTMLTTAEPCPECAIETGLFTQLEGKVNVVFCVPRAWIFENTPYTEFKPEATMMHFLSMLSSNPKIIANPYKSVACYELFKQNVKLSILGQQTLARKLEAPVHSPKPYLSMTPINSRQASADPVTPPSADPVTPLTESIATMFTQRGTKRSNTDTNTSPATPNGVATDDKAMPRAKRMLSNSLATVDETEKFLAHSCKP